jgi:replicative DNA helicase
LSRIEEQILTSLLKNEEYVRAVLPFLKPDYFADEKDRNIFSEITKFFEKYNSCPTKEAIAISLGDSKRLSEQQFAETIDVLKEIHEIECPDNDEWLIDETEKFVQERAIYNGIMDSIQIIKGEDKKRNTGSIPGILTDALAVSFDPHLGHNYVEDADDRFDFYHKKENKIPFDLECFNKATNGGVPAKTLNVILAPTGVGKTLIKCHLAASYLSQQKNVVYFTCEMAEERIAERIDANLMDIALDDLKTLPEKMYKSKIEKIKSTVKGSLIIKEYPPAVAHAGHFRHFLEELRLKKKIVPDVIFVDYLNLCASSRMKSVGGAVNTYVMVKAIAEELRGLAVEYNIPLWSSTQTNREGYQNSDVSLTNTSESFGLPATADFMVAAIRTEEMDKINQIGFKQLKNRYTDLTNYSRFFVGVDRPKMKLYELSQSATYGETSQDTNTSVNGVDNSTMRTGNSRGNDRSRFNKFKF